MTHLSQARSGVLRDDRSGLALVEFALTLPLIILLLALVIDLGFSFNARLNTMRGVTAGALYAFDNGGTVTASTASDLRTKIAAIVQQMAGSAAPTVTVLVNNAASSTNADNFYCTAGFPVQWTSTGTSSGSCADGTMSAKFVTITTSGTAASPIPLAAFGQSVFPLAETVVVRMK